MADALRTLIVDDEARIRLFLKETLRRDGYIITEAESGEQALELLQDTAFDIVLLDLMLGGRIDGQRVLEAIRWRWPATIVIMISAQATLESAVDAIQEGVDGFLLKPVEPSDVRSAIEQAIHKRKQRAELHQSTSANTITRLGPFEFNMDTHQVTRDGKEINLTPNEFTLLVYLMQNSQQVVDPITLVEVVRQYKPDYLHEARQIIKWYIHRLRQKVELDPTDPKHIINVRGVGYMFKP